MFGSWLSLNGLVQNLLGMPRASYWCLLPPVYLMTGENILEGISVCVPKYLCIHLYSKSCLKPKVAFWVVVFLRQPKRGSLLMANLISLRCRKSLPSACAAEYQGGFRLMSVSGRLWSRNVISPVISWEYQTRMGVYRIKATLKKIILSLEFFTVPHVFLPESAGIRVIPGIPQNGILAVLPAKIVISIPRNSGGFRNGHGITGTESTGTEFTESFLMVIVNFKSNSNYLIVITVN